MGKIFAMTGPLLPAEVWQRKAVGFGIGIYYLQPPVTDPVAAARALAADKRFALKVVDKLDEAAQSEALLSIYLSSNVAKDYPPPTIESLRYFGNGLSRDQAEALQGTKRVLILGFAHPAKLSTQRLMRAQEFVLELAKHENAIIWDDETRVAFTPEAWERIRLKTWEGGVPDVSKQIVIHAYNNGGRTRAISLGMGRFGFPDLVINDSVWSLNRPLGNAINAVAQQLVEAGPPDQNGVLHLEIANLRHMAAKKILMEGILSGGKGEGRLRLLETKAEAGDPQNALAQLSFDSYPGQDVTERQTNFVMDVFGAQPSEVVYRRDNAALRAASARARAQLADIKGSFLKGLAPGEQLLVKAPFITNDGGREWMWVEVIEWKGDQIKGMLRSDPRHVPGLKAGQIVESRQADIFDYLRIFPDGHTEGNETSKLLK